MFTIGICSSDRDQFLNQALQSVYDQDYSGPIEIVIADDNSDFSIEESIKAIAQALKQKNIKIKLVKHQDSSGTKKAGEATMRNLIISHSASSTLAQGDLPLEGEEKSEVEDLHGDNYIVWLDDDDKLLPTALSGYTKAIKENPDTEIFYGNLIRTDLNFQPQQRYQYRDIPRLLLPSSLLLGSIIPNGGSCIRKSVFEKIGNYDPSFKVATDYQFWARASLSPVKFKHINQDIYLYRSHQNNAALDKEDENFFETNGRVCELLLQNCPPQHLFPFFEWKENKHLADCKVILAVLTLAKRNRRKFLIENCHKELENNTLLRNQIENTSSLAKVLENLIVASDLTFDQTAQIISKIVEARQKNELNVQQQS